MKTRERSWIEKKAPSLNCLGGVKPDQIRSDAGYNYVKRQNVGMDYGLVREPHVIAKVLYVRVKEKTREEKKQVIDTI